jgi:hypothetical protein
MGEMGNGKDDRNGDGHAVSMRRRKSMDGSRKEEEHTLGSPRDRASHLWSTVKHQLVEFHSLPEYLRDNNYILRYYRANWTLKQALFSVFSLHNETFNIWTYVTFPFPPPSIHAYYGSRNF